MYRDRRLYRSAVKSRLRPRSHIHLWIGSLLSGLLLGLVFSVAFEARAARPQNVILALADVAPVRLARDSHDTPSYNTALLADLKAMMQQVQEARRSLEAARIEIADLRQENQALREANLSAEKKVSAARTSGLAHVTALTPNDDKQDGQQITLPMASLPPPPSPIAAMAGDGKAKDDQGGNGQGGPLFPIAAADSGSTRKGPKACWSRAGSMVSIYRIEIGDEGFVLSPAWDALGAADSAWPGEFAPIMAKFSAKPITERKTITRPEFMKAMRPYYDFGMSKGHCRFLVTVSNSTTSDTAWADGLEVVERYFFKKLRGRTPGVASAQPPDRPT